VLALIAAGGVAAALASQWSRLSDTQWRVRPGWLALSVLAFFVFQAINAQTWTTILRWLGAPLPIRRAHAVWSASVLTRYVPTNALVFVTRAGMLARDGVAWPVAVASTFYEFALAFVAAVALSAYFVIVLPDLSDQPLRFLVVLPALAVLALVHPRVLRRLSDVVLRRLGQAPLPTMLPPRRIAAIVAMYIATLLAAGAGVLALARGLHPVGASHVPAVLGSYAVGFAVGLAAFVLPGGLGAREGGTAAALAPAVPTAVAIAAAVAARLVQTLVELIYTGGAWLLAGRAGLAFPRPAEGAAPPPQLWAASDSNREPRA
jgi:uncharacterized membrane protein YbhN (UPF0104 family)